MTKLHPGYRWEPQWMWLVWQGATDEPRSRPRRGGRRLRRVPGGQLRVAVSLTPESPPPVQTLALDARSTVRAREGGVELD
jgi:hypothetical protein